MVKKTMVHRFCFSCRPGMVKGFIWKPDICFTVASRSTIRLKNDMDANKGAGFTVLNVNDLGEQFSKDKEALRAKYEGKEVVVLGHALKDFETEFYGAETQDLRLVGDMSNPNHATASCTCTRRTRTSSRASRRGPSSPSRA